jgi:UDP-glucose 4-epimerase
MTGYLDSYHDRAVLVTGGLGFVGSNLCRRLADLGARVTSVDSLLPEYGGQGIVFNLAGQVSHIDSMTDPFTDLEINCRSQLWILEALRKRNPEAKIVYAGTRQIYGRPQRLPVDEEHALAPADVNGINKISGEFYHLVYHQVYGIRACSLRLTNTFGPRQLIRHNRQGFIGWFVRNAVLGETIEVFGDGAQRRDFDYVDDVVDAFLRAGASEDSNGQVFNLGGGPPISLLDLAQDLVKLSGGSQIKVVPFPAERKKIDIGDFYSDARKIERVLGWKSRTPFFTGLERTMEYYRKNKDRYL